MERNRVNQKRIARSIYYGHNKEDICFRKSPPTPLACLCGREKIAKEE
jgi:hypothetical protein